MAAGAKCHLKTPRNFQQSAMLEGSEITEAEGLSVDSTLASSVTACKKVLKKGQWISTTAERENHWQVLCSNSVLDSADYWLQNEKALCRLALLDGDADGSCTTVSILPVNLWRVNATLLNGGET